MVNITVFPISRDGQRNGRRAPHLSGIASPLRAGVHMIDDRLHVGPVEFCCQEVVLVRSDGIPRTWDDANAFTAHRNWRDGLRTQSSVDRFRRADETEVFGTMVTGGYRLRCVDLPGQDG
jgi:hypothetical protein